MRIAAILTLLIFATSAGADSFEDTRVKAEQGNATAQYDLGVMYIDGEGVLKDHAEAVAWFRKAAEQGLSNAQYNRVRT